MSVYLNPREPTRALKTEEPLLVIYVNFTIHSTRKQNTTGLTLLKLLRTYDRTSLPPEGRRKTRTALCHCQTTGRVLTGSTRIDPNNLQTTFPPAAYPASSRAVVHVTGRDVWCWSPGRAAGRGGDAEVALTIYSGVTHTATRLAERRIQRDKDDDTCVRVRWRPLLVQATNPFVITGCTGKRQKKIDIWNTSHLSIGKTKQIILFGKLVLFGQWHQNSKNNLITSDHSDT